MQSSTSADNPKQSEKLQIALLFLYGFGNAAAYLLCRTVADSEFLSRYGSDRLPQLYMMSAAAVALVSIGYSRLLRSAGLKRTVVFTLSSFAIVTVVIAFLIAFFVDRMSDAIALFAILYFVSQIRGSLATIQFATVLNEQYTRTGPVQVIGIVGFGATAAGALIGLVTSLMPDSIPVSNLLLLAAVFDILTIVPLLMLRALRRSLKEKKKPRKAKNKKPKKEPKRHGVFTTLKSRYVAGIATIVCCSIMATTVVEYDWKAAAASEMNGDSHSMVRFFGFFYGTVYFLTGSMQLLLTSRILRSNQLLLGLLVYPISMLVGLGFVVANSGGAILGALSIWKGSDVLRRSLHDPSVQILYSPLKRRFRRMAITSISGIAKPITEAIAGVWILIGSSLLPADRIHYLSLPWLLIWLAVAFFVWQSFANHERRPT